MTVLYDLSNTGPRKIGMNRKTNFASLHGNALQAKDQTRTPSPEDINAPPQDSSDEASVIAEEDANTKNTIESKECSSGSRSPRSPTRGKSDSPEVEKEQDEAPLDPSIIPPSKLKSSIHENSLHGSQGSRPLGMAVIDEDEGDPFGMSSQASKKRKTAYGSSSQRSTQENIHHGPVKAQRKKPLGRNNSSASKDGNQFIRLLPNVGDTMNRGM